MINKSNYYQIYLNSVFQLAETIVIKSLATVEALNRYVNEYYGADAVDTLDPGSWKYYQNIAGEYHFSDEVMRVVSMDTLEEITFSKETLLIHRATARGYVYGTRQYKELVSRYPGQEMLILGILYPADKAKAIAAEDGKILSYPKALIEVNEYSLESKLQRWIDGYLVRWTNKQYGISDDLYPATALGIMYLNLVPAILTLRLEACKTNEAHSYHVRQYLASHGMLDVYMDQMTLKQTLFFYRNIAYIERNSGQKNIFEWLVEHIMTERNLPIAEYVMRHNLKDQPENLYPEVTFRKNPLNLGYDIDPTETLSLDEILQKEDKLARDNSDVRLNEIGQIQQTMENSLSNVVLTKALESAMWDYSNATPYTLEDTLINHWLWLSSSGYYYQAVVAINNPKTGERIPMVVKDAFIFMWYAFCKSIEIDLETIPAMFAKRVQRIPMRTVDQIMEVVDTKWVPRSVAVEALSLQPTITNMISTEAFYNKCVEINQACQMQRMLISKQEHQMARGMVHGLVSQIYSDNIVRLAPEGTTYDQWFEDRNIRIADFTREDMEVAYLSLMRDATGLSLTTTNSLRALQAAMVKMLAQLSSYSIQFMTKINAVDIRVGDSAAIRVGDQLSRMSGHQYVQDLSARVLEMHARLKQRVAMDISGSGAGYGLTLKMQQGAHLEITPKPQIPKDVASRLRIRLNTAPVYVNGLHNLQPNAEGIIPVPGLDAFLPLTAGERAQFRDVWRLRWPVWPPADQADLDVVLADPYLDGFNPPVSKVDLPVVVITNHLDGFNVPGSLFDLPVGISDVYPDGFDLPLP